MAEKLKQEYDIVVLKVELLDKRPNVLFTLQAKVDGKLNDISSWKSDLSDMGFAPQERGRRMTYEDITGNLRGEMLIDLSKWIIENKTSDNALWVHLVKPYGLLRFVPWERALGGALSVPILMLPDFIFPPPRESSSVLDVALCASAPLDYEQASVDNTLHNVSHRILEAAARRTRLHIFADLSISERLRDEFADEGRLDDDVFVYSNVISGIEPDEEPSSVIVERPGELRSPWLLWMRQELRAQSIDVVHFLCHGYLTRDRGALLFAQSPIARTDRYLAGPVGHTELRTFLTQVGAWSTAFTSLPDDNSEPGLRGLADEIAQSRPGPLLMNTMRSDPNGDALVDAYRFLYSVDPTEAPTSTQLFMYCQPYRVKTKAVGDQPRRVRSMEDHTGSRNTRQLDIVFRAAADTSPLAEVLRKQERTLPWVASTERWAEQVQLRFQQRARDDDDAEAHDAESDLREKETLETVNRLRASVARMASKDEDLVIEGFGSGGADAGGLI